MKTLKLKGYKFCLLKAYFDKGYGLTSYIKIMLVLFGILSFAKEIPLEYTVIAGFVYGLVCFIIGWLWYKYDFVLSEAEVSNQFNLFQREMRKEIGAANNRKV